MNSKIDNDRYVYGRSAAVSREEVQATEKIRKANPLVPAKTLVRKLLSVYDTDERHGLKLRRSRNGSEFNHVFFACFGVPFYTIYSRIRRYDAKQKAKVA